MSRGKRATACGAALLTVLVASAANTVGARAQQAQIPAVVTQVTDGQRVETRLADGRSARVRLIGIDTPAATECGGMRAKDQLTKLVQRRAVTLVADPVQGPTDDDGRFLLYVDRSDGIDAGEQLVLTGAAKIDPDSGGFDRESAYTVAQGEARADRAGVWDRCRGDIHLTVGEERRARRRSAQAFVRTYYRNLTLNRFATAWRMLGKGVRRKNGSYRRWKAGHRSSLGTAVQSARGRLSGRRAVVSVSLLSRDRDACSRRIVRQRFRGRWVLAARGDSWVAGRLRIRKTAGRRVRVSKSECRPVRRQRRKGGGGGGGDPSPPPNCQGYSPCLPPGGDVDCEGGSGNGPRYVPGPVTVKGSDPYDLDRDGDGTGCDT